MMKPDESSISGFWVRTIRDIDGEIKILDKRKSYTHAEWRLGHRSRDKSNSKWTHYSPATYVIDGVPIFLHNRKGAGIIFTHTFRAAHWYDGCNGEKLSDPSLRGCDIDYEKEHLDNGSGEEHQLYYPSSKKIEQRLKSIHKQWSKEDENTILPWNEGLLRYGYKDIKGIYVNLDSQESCKKAVDLKDALLKKGVTSENLRYYRLEKGCVYYTNPDAVNGVAKKGPSYAVALYAHNRGRNEAGKSAELSRPGMTR